MTLVEIRELKDDKERVVALVKYDGEVSVTSGDDDTDESIMGYVTHSEPTGTWEDGDAWVKSLPEAIAYPFFWAQIVDEQPAVRMGVQPVGHAANQVYAAVFKESEAVRDKGGRFSKTEWVGGTHESIKIGDRVRLSLAASPIVGMKKDLEGTVTGKDDPRFQAASIEVSWDDDVTTWHRPGDLQVKKTAPKQPTPEKKLPKPVGERKGVGRLNRENAKRGVKVVDPDDGAEGVIRKTKDDPGKAEGWRVQVEWKTGSKAGTKSWRAPRRLRIADEMPKREEPAPRLDEGIADLARQLNLEPESDSDHESEFELPQQAPTNVPPPLDESGRVEMEKALNQQTVSGIKVLNTGITDSYTAKLEDGTKVVIKERGRRPGIRQNIDDARGPEHSVAAMKVSDFLELDSPRVVIRNSDSLLEDTDADATDVRRGTRIANRSDSISLQNWVPGSRKLVFEDRPAQRDQAEKFAVLDYMIANTDRHQANYLGRGDDVVPIDHDLSFPHRAETRGNVFGWETRHHEVLAGQSIPPALMAKIREMADDREGWREKLSELNDDEFVNFYERVLTLERTGMFPEPYDMFGGRNVVRERTYQP